MDTRSRDQPVAAWLDHLRVERGLADNTLAAYEDDLHKLAVFAEKRRRALLSLEQGELIEFVA